jgi:hypothetical protein
MTAVMSVYLVKLALRKFGKKGAYVLMVLPLVIVACAFGLFF